MNKKFMGALIFLIPGIYGLVLSAQLPLGTRDVPGPGFFPLGLSILLCLFGVFQLILGRTVRDGVAWRTVGKNLITPLRIVLLTVVFILMLPRLGYLIASSVYLFTLLFCVSHYKVWMSAFLALFLGIGSSYFFSKFLAVQLPVGLWSF